MSVSSTVALAKEEGRARASLACSWSRFAYGFWKSVLPSITLLLFSYSSYSIAQETSVGEPSSWLWMGIGYTPHYQRYSNFSNIYNDEVRSYVRSVLESIDCPILLLDSDPTGFEHADFRYAMRELVDLGKRAKLIAYAGYKHGFYFGYSELQMTGQELDEVIKDVHSFILPLLRTKPSPL